jgi:hypothetical protein
LSLFCLRFLLLAFAMVVDNIFCQMMRRRWISFPWRLCYGVYIAQRESSWKYQEYVGLCLACLERRTRFFFSAVKRWKGFFQQHISDATFRSLNKLCKNISQSSCKKLGRRRICWYA